MSARLFACSLSVLVLSSLGADHAAAQERRRSPDGGSAPPPRAGVPMDPRVPFAGGWHGMRRMQEGPGVEGMPYEIVIEADSAGRRYTGYAVLPNGARAPLDRVTESNGVLTWRQPNSGGGMWEYTARLAGRGESIQGTLILRDWPQGGGAQPTGTFTLARRPPA